MNLKPIRLTMKVRPKNYETFEDYAYSNGFNPDEFDTFHTERILPKDYKTRIKHSEIISANSEFNDDLYDFDVELETRKANKIPKFHRKLSIAEMDGLSAGELLAYHQFLIDYAAEKESESKT